MSFAVLSDLRADYDALFCDVWGVLRDGRALLPDAVEALHRYRLTGGAVCLVSNSPRRGYDLIERLRDMGFPDDAWDAVVTSGDATHAELLARSPGKALRIGTEFDVSLYEGLDLEFTSVEEADFISCTGPDDYWNGKPEDYRETLAIALERELVMVCANPDIVVQAGDQLIYCAGAIARVYREMGGTSVVSGKPHRPIYALARSALANIGLAVPDSRILMVGDGPETDLEGAKRAGIDALFIADGILADDLETGTFDPDAVVDALASYGASAKFLAPRLCWQTPQGQAD